MKKLQVLIITVLIAAQGFSQRNDAAVLVNVSTITYNGSLQNGSWSPDNQFLMCTNWESGYNQYPANIFIIDLSDYSFTPLTTDGESNVNMTGLTWSPIINKVIFSSEHSGDGDQAHLMEPDGLSGSAVRITPWTDRMCWEPGFSPDGEWIVYEAHYISNPDNGIIETYKIDGTQGPFQLTDNSVNAKQPSWSPAGDKIAYQKFEGSKWDVWTMNSDGANKQSVTGADEGDKTDATFSPNGEWIVYSADNGELDYANIFIKNLTTEQITQVTSYSGYDGAPSWSSDNKIVFESTTGDPDVSSGSTLWIIEAPVNGTVGIETTNDNRINDIIIYPNPARNFLKVLLNKCNFKNNVTLKIYNSIGQLVKEYCIKINNENVITKNISDFDSGIYYITISDKKLIKTSKLIITK